MTAVCSRNVVINFKYTIKALIMFNSKIVLIRIDFERKCLFCKLEKDLMLFTKIYADIQFLKI